MANTQTFSIKLTANGKEVKELQEELIKLANKYEEDLKGINEQLKERDKLTKEEIKTLEQQSNSLASKIKGLNTAVEENITNLRTVNDVMKNLAGSSSGELGKALRGLGSDFKRVSDQTLKAGETMEKKLTEIKEKMMEVRHEMAKREGIDAMKRAQATLQELADTPLDKLKMGLDSIEKKLATMSNAERQAADGLTLMQGRAQYKAQIALTELGGAGFSSDIPKMNEEQLRAEQQRLRSLYGATNGAKGFEIISQEALNRLHEVNDALAEMRKNVDGIDLSKVNFNDLNATSLEELDAILKQIEKDEKKLTASDKMFSEYMAANKRKVQEAIQRVKNNTIDLANAQKVARERGKHSVQDMQRAYDTLKIHLTTLSTSQKKEIAETQQQMKQLKADIDRVTGAVSNQNSIWKTAVRNITAYVGVFGMFNLVKNKLTEVIRGSEELSDQMAQVRMVSGLAMEDIEGLTRSLAKLDTRTTLKELNEIAYAGAKLGFGDLGVGALEEFTKAANQVNVALKESLGNEAMTALSKITENMGLIKKMGVEQAMLSTSSAMFKLFTTSTAAAGPIVEITRRLAPMAQISGFATHEILALASANDALMQSEEVAGTALSKFMMAMQTNHNIIEKTLGITEGTISKMMKSGQSMEALLLILDKMSGKNVTELTNIWKLLGSEGDRLKRVLIAMANHTDIVRQHLDTSNKAFKEATAVTEEYNIQQETAMAYLERADNKWRNAFINPDSAQSVKEMTKAWYDFTKSITDSDTALGAIKVTVDFLLISLRALIALLPAITFGLMAKGAALLYDKLSLAKISADGFTASWKKMDAATKSNWIGLIVGSLVQAVYWFSQLAKSMSNAGKEQKKLNDAIEKMHEKTDVEIKNLARLKNQLDDTNISQEERNALLSKVKKDYDIYLEYLGIEKNRVLDLTKYYDALVKVMRQRFAYEERENYKRDVMGGEDGVRMKRRHAGADLKRMGVGINADVDLSLIDQYVQNGAKTAGEVFVKMFPDIENTIAARQKTGLKSGKYEDFAKQFAKYFGTVREESNMEAEIDAAFASEIGDFDYDKWLRTQVMGEFKLQPDKNAEKEAKKAAQEAKEAMRKKMQDAQKESTGVLSKLEEWYRLQEAAITEARADGKMTEEQAAQMVNTLNIYKNESLATARRAITTGDTAAWDKLKTEVMPKAMADASDLSQNLLETIQNVPVQVLHDNLAKFNGDPKKVFGLDSRAFFDQINAKAAGNTREAARLRAKLFKQAEKLLEQYDAVRVAQTKMQKDLEGIGIFTETYEEFANRMQNGITEQPPKTLKNGKTITAEEAFAQMGAKFIGQGTIPYRINIENADEALQWIRDFGTDAQGELENFAQAFPKVEEMIVLQQKQKELLEEQNRLKEHGRDLDEKQKEELEQISQKLAESVPTIKAMFYLLETSSNQIADTIKKQVEQMMGRKPIGLDEMRDYHEKEMKAFEADWQKYIDAANATNATKNEEGDTDAAVELKRQRDQQLIDLEHQYQQELWSIREQYGLKIYEQYQKELEALEYMHAKGLISEKKYQSERLKLIAKTGVQYAQYFQQQYGQKMTSLIDTLKDYEITSTEDKYDRMIAAAKANGQDTTKIEEEKEAAILEIKKKYAAAELAMKIAEIGINTAAGIMQAWVNPGFPGAIPLTVMIGALGAAQTALAIAEYNKAMGQSVSGSKNTASTSTNTKTKLASGMLTYDKGNVKRFVGQDGKVYTATEEPTPKDGLVTHPIATTVQGQPALVAENGPEIVVGRETTKAIMMNEPELIRYLANYQQHGGRGYLPYDSGNVQSVAMPSQQSDPAAAEREALRQRLDRSDELMAQVLYYLQNPIPPEIAMYDNGGKKGLHSKIKEANSFMARYGG